MTMFDGLPSVVRVGAYDYSIELVEDHIDPDDWGNVNVETYTIKIKKNHPNSIRALETVIHEIKHALWDFFHMKDGMSEEEVVRIMSVGWAMVYRDNPDLLVWIGEAAHGE